MSDTSKLLNVELLQTYTNELKKEELIINDTKPVPQTIGGISAGTTFDNTKVVDVLHNLLYPYTQPECTLHVEPRGGLYEVGTPVTVTQWIASIYKKSEPISSVVIQTDGGITIYTMTDTMIANINEGNGTITNNGDINITLSSNIHFVMTVTDATNRQYVVQSEKFRFVKPLYVGKIIRSQTIINDNVVNTLTKRVTEFGSYFEESFTLNDEKILFLYPNEYGRLQSITDQNGYDITSSFDTAETDIIIANNQLATYRYYLQYDSSTVTDFKVRFNLSA